LAVDETIRQMILKRAEAAAIRQAAMSQGMQTMAEDGWAKVAQGLTTTQEVLRVTQE
jgi:general secretion pathway protein E